MEDDDDLDWDADDNDFDLDDLEYDNVLTPTDLTPDMIKAIEAYAMPKLDHMCMHGTIDNSNHVHKYAFGGCHSSISGPPADTVACWNAIGPGNCDIKVHDTFISWLTDPAVSPWRDCLGKDYHGFTDKHGQYIQVVGRLDRISAQLLCSFFKAGRMYSERPQHGQLFNDLVDNGVHPSVAFYFAQVLYGVEGTYNWYENWHGSVFDLATHGGLKSFVSGQYKKNVPYTEKHIYSYVDSIFTNDDYKFKGNLEKEFNMGPSSAKTRWCGTLTIPSITLPKLIQACKHYEQELGLEPFHPQQQAA